MRKTVLFTVIALGSLFLLTVASVTVVAATMALQSNDTALEAPVDEAAPVAAPVENSTIHELQFEESTVIQPANVEDNKMEFEAAPQRNYGGCGSKVDKQTNL